MKKSYFALGIVVLASFFLYLKSDRIEERRNPISPDPKEPASRSRSTERFPLSSPNNAHQSTRVQNRDVKYPVALEEFRAMGINSSRFSTLDEEGKLSMQVIREANLTESESLAVQKCFDKHNSKMREIISRSVVVDKIRTDPDNNLFAFTIPKFSELGREELNTLVDNLDKHIGSSKRILALGGYSPSSRYFGYGTNDLSIRFHKGEDIGAIASEAFHIPKENWMVETVQTDANSGKVLSKGECSLIIFNKTYPGIFEIRK